MRKALTYLLSTIFLLMACEKKVIWNFDEQDLNRLVVDGIITNEMGPQKIDLSLTNASLNSAYNPLTGAIVTVDDGSISYDFKESENEPGSYYSSPFQAVINNNYSLSISYGGETYEAYAEIIGVSSPDTFGISMDTLNKRYHFEFYGLGHPSMTKVYYDWSYDTGYCAQYGNCYAQETYYNLDNNDVNAVFAAKREILYFPSGTKITRKKYSLTDAHQQFLRSLLMETDWSGGIFDVQHGNVPSNISNGGLGYFAACMVVSDTIFIE